MVFIVLFWFVGRISHWSFRRLKNEAEIVMFIRNIQTILTWPVSHNKICFMLHFFISYETVRHAYKNVWTKLLLEMKSFLELSTTNICLSYKIVFYFGRRHLGKRKHGHLETILSIKFLMRSSKFKHQQIA